MYQAGESQLVLQRVGQVDVADAAFVLLDIGVHALVALAADAGGPLYRGAFADLRLPFGADLRQVVDEVEGGAGAVGALDHGDLLVGQLHAALERGDGRVVPLLALAEEDVGPGFAVELLPDRNSVLQATRVPVRRHLGARRTLQQNT